jgi:UDP-sugar transporter A1/2/3
MQVSKLLSISLYSSIIPNNTVKKKAIGGIIVAGTMKYADNILKTFASAHSIALSCVLSYYFLLGDDDTFTPTFFFGTLVIIFATFLYSSVKTVPHHHPIAASLPSKNRRLLPYSTKV